MGSFGSKQTLETDYKWPIYNLHNFKMQARHPAGNGIISAKRATSSAQSSSPPPVDLLGIKSGAFLAQTRSRHKKAPFAELLGPDKFIDVCARLVSDIDRCGGFERVYGTDAWRQLPCAAEFAESGFEEHLSIKEFFLEFLLRAFLKREFGEKFDEAIDEKLFVEPNWVYDEKALDKIARDKMLFRKYDSVVVMRGFMGKWGLNAALYSLESIKQNYGSTPINVIEQNPKGESFQTQASEMFQKRMDFTVAKYVEYQENMRHVRLDSESFRSTRIKFGVNIDIGDWQEIMHDLQTRLPDWVRFKSPLDCLRYIRQDIEGITLPQLYLKVAGSWTGGHEENLRIMAVNINTGQGDVEWHCVPPEDVEKFRRKVLECEGVDIHKAEGLWFTHYMFCLRHGIRVMKWIQQPGDVVILRPGTLHWVRSCSVTTNVAWNISHFNLEDLEKIDIRYRINRQINFKTIIANKTLFLDVLNNGYDRVCRDSVDFLLARLEAFVREAEARKARELPEQELAKWGVQEFQDDINSNNIIFCSRCYEELFMFWGICEAALPDGFFCIRCFKAHLEQCPHEHHDFYRKYKPAWLERLFKAAKKMNKRGRASKSKKKKQADDGELEGVSRMFSEFVDDLNQKRPKKKPKSRGPLVRELAATKFYIGDRENGQKKPGKAERARKTKRVKGKMVEGAEGRKRARKLMVNLVESDKKGREAPGEGVDTGAKCESGPGKKSAEKEQSKRQEKRPEIKLKSRQKQAEPDRANEGADVKLGKREFYMKSDTERNQKNVQIGNRKKVYNILGSKAFLVQRQSTVKEDLIYKLNKVQHDDLEKRIKRKKKQPEPSRDSDDNWRKEGDEPGEKPQGEDGEKEQQKESPAEQREEEQGMEHKEADAEPQEPQEPQKLQEPQEPQELQEPPAPNDCEEGENKTKEIETKQVPQLEGGEDGWGKEGEDAKDEPKKAKWGKTADQERMEKMQKSGQDGFVLSTDSTNQKEWNEMIMEDYWNNKKAEEERARESEWDSQGTEKRWDDRGDRDFGRDKQERPEKRAPRRNEWDSECRRDSKKFEYRESHDARNPKQHHRDHSSRNCFYLGKSSHREKNHWGDKKFGSRPEYERRSDFRGPRRHYDRGEYAGHGPRSWKSNQGYRSDNRFEYKWGRNQERERDRPGRFGESRHWREREDRGERDRRWGPREHHRGGHEGRMEGRRRGYRGRGGHRRNPWNVRHRGVGQGGRMGGGYERGDGGWRRNMWREEKPAENKWETESGEKRQQEETKTGNKGEMDGREDWGAKWEEEHEVASERTELNENAKRDLFLLNQVEQKKLEDKLVDHNTKTDFIIFGIDEEEERPKKKITREDLEAKQKEQIFCISDLELMNLRQKILQKKKTLICDKIMPDKPGPRRFLSEGSTCLLDKVVENDFEYDRDMELIDSYSFSFERQRIPDDVTKSLKRRISENTVVFKTTRDAGAIGPADKGEEFKRLLQRICLVMEEMDLQGANEFSRVFRERFVERLFNAPENNAILEFYCSRHKMEEVARDFLRRLRTRSFRADSVHFLKAFVLVKDALSRKQCQMIREFLGQVGLDQRIIGIFIN